MIAVSLNIGSGIRLIKPAKLACTRKTLQTQQGRTQGAGCVRQWFRTAEPLGERRYENWNTHTHAFSVQSLLLKEKICSSKSWPTLKWGAKKEIVTVQTLCIGTDRSRQTVQTMIRLLLKKQSDQGLCCLPFHQHLLDALIQCYIKLFLF